MFQTGYIVSPRADGVWFLALPLLALALALACEHWLSAVALTSIALLINGPHNFVTLFRTYGLAEDRRRFADRLILGGIVCLGLVAVGLTWAPVTFVMVTVMWNHQHSLMQIHGFSRIYDFKAQTGAANTGRWDLRLNAVVYVNMFVTAPLFTNFWLRELYRFEIPVTVEAVRMIHLGGWICTIAFVVTYLGHLVRCVSNGGRLNPIKYMFMLSTYLVLYVTAWMDNASLVHILAAVTMHGVQYMVIVYYYMQRKSVQESERNSWVSWIVQPGHAMLFVLICLAYVLVIQFASSRPLGELGFGLFQSMATAYKPIPSHGLPGMSTQGGFELFAVVAVTLPGTLHLYYDSFIWKVRDKNIHGGL